MQLYCGHREQLVPLNVTAKKFNIYAIFFTDFGDIFDIFREIPFDEPSTDVDLTFLNNLGRHVVKEVELTSSLMDLASQSPINVAPLSTYGFEECYQFSTIYWMKFCKTVKQFSM